ncbi:uncharacterized protein LOC122629577 isoform X2 [Vespula pensylvanica]|uniref:uncharacterized protein LOC122629577 isoform X2 n=1 Tax=Vespula pensylvanica TaxID=30213 RepID=UPI001CBA382E|nr:uncharacterized protein LOC122629577 isoform X2 [Vespula pensylvanica]XP_050850084.1 uncharacterized protein LOC127063857 isoform X2 [Vespula vulgaris]
MEVEPMCIVENETEGSRGDRKEGGKRGRKPGRKASDKVDMKAKLVSSMGTRIGSRTYSRRATYGFGGIGKPETGEEQQLKQEIRNLEECSANVSRSIHFFSLHRL